MTDAYKSGKTKVLFAIAGDYKFAWLTLSWS
jgi:hypothetical protein